MALKELLSDGFSASFPSSETPGPSTKVTLSHGAAQCEVYLFGAHVVSWKVDGKEHLWMSSLSPMDGSGPIRGGVPIAFPQFADQGQLRLHGFARDGLWTVVCTESNDDEHRIVLERSEDDETLSLWPHKFRLKYTVSLGATSLSFSLDVANTGSDTFSFTGCFHTYFRTPDIRKVQLFGLKGSTFTDKVDGFQEKTEENECIAIAEASNASKGFVDRIYKNTPNTVTLDDSGSASSFKISQSPSWRDTVVFNPWEEGKKGEKGPDFDDDGFNYMLCVEPAVTAHAPQVVQAGTSWSGWQRIDLVRA
eukprot:TRINITY_DN17063_c0_g1_i1.p1 TRINITY_DN17063_c0_g1~~TRINITY_DN17063_c0_g1_i1.p1  ORF type:complete len:307 (-),score=55.54 TRINITY_DN17063_c0_g1_i1:134-1054(-)